MASWKYPCGCSGLRVAARTRSPLKWWIWHAAVDRAQTWVWWASGIVLGAAVLALFALFEKRRNDVLRVIEDIKQWK